MKPERIMMSNEKIFEWIKETVAECGNEHTEPESDPQELTKEDVFIVWFCKTCRTGRRWPRQIGLTAFIMS